MERRCLYLGVKKRKKLETMNTQAEIQSLQNFADKFGLTVKECFYEDKRKKTKYLLIKDNISVSNDFTYEEMNIFLTGILRAKEFNL